MLKAFREKHAHILGAFKKIYLEIKMISILEREITILNNALESLNEVYAYLVREQLCVSDTLEEKIGKMECDVFSTLKIENENLKGQLTRVVSLSNVVSTFSIDRGNNFNKKNLPMSLEKIE